MNAVAFARLQGQEHAPHALLSIAFVLTLTGNVEKHQVWFFRYEAYLIAMGLFVMPGALPTIWREGRRGWGVGRENLPAVCALAVLGAFPLAGLMNRAGDAIPQVPGRSGTSTKSRRRWGSS